MNFKIIIIIYNKYVGIQRRKNTSVASIGLQTNLCIVYMVRVGTTYLEDIKHLGNNGKK